MSIAYASSRHPIPKVQAPHTVTKLYDVDRMLGEDSEKTDEDYDGVSSLYHCHHPILGRLLFDVHTRCARHRRDESVGRQITSFDRCLLGNK